MGRNFYSFFFTLFISFFLLPPHIAEAQIAIGSERIEPSAILDVSSTHKGFLGPRLDSVAVADFSKPVQGLWVFIKDSYNGKRGFFTYQDGEWIHSTDLHNRYPFTSLLKNIFSRHYLDKSLGFERINFLAVSTEKIRDSSLKHEDIRGQITDPNKVLDRSIEVSKVSPSLFGVNTNNDGLVLEWNQKIGLWTPRLLLNIPEFKGFWIPDINTPELSPSDGVTRGVSDGAYYIAAADGLAKFNDGTQQFFTAGDRVIYDRGTWKRIENNNFIISVFGSVGDVSSGIHYTIDQLDLKTSDINDLTNVIYTPSGLEDEDLLTWNNSSRNFGFFEAQKDVGSPRQRVSSTGFALESVTGDKITDSITTDKIKDQSIRHTSIKTGAVESRNIGDKNILPIHFAPSDTIKNMSVIRYDGGRWTVKFDDFDITFKDAWTSAIPIKDDDYTRGISLGTTYIVQERTSVTPATGRTLDVNIGDILIYDPSDTVWSVVGNTFPTYSFNGRDKVINAEIGDYDWSQISPINATSSVNDLDDVSYTTPLSATATSRAVLRYSATASKFEAMIDIGSIKEPLDSQNIASRGTATYNIQDASIYNGDMADDIVDSIHLKTNVIDSSHILSNTLTSNKIDTVFSPKFAPLAFGTSNVKDGSIDSTHLSSGILVGIHFATNSVDSNALADSAVDNISQIKLQSITPATVANMTLLSRHFAKKSIRTSAIADETLEMRHLRKSVFFDSTHFAHKSIDSTDINGVVADSRTLSTDVVESIHMSTDAVSQSRLQAGLTIGASKLAVGFAAQSIHVVDSSISANDIKAKSISNDALSNRSIKQRHLVNSLIISNNKSDVLNTRAKLEVRSTTKGMMLPRLTSAERATLEASLGGTDAGLIVMDTTRNTVVLWEGDMWRSIGGKGSFFDPYIPHVGERGYLEGDYIMDRDSTVYGVVQSAGLLWLDRNLGAESTTDIGHYYQWGRRRDGHQDTASTTTAIVLNSKRNTPSTFVTGSNAWLDYDDASAWMGVSAQENPCPDGWQVPTEVQLEALLPATGTLPIPKVDIVENTGQRQRSGTMSLADVFFWTSNSIDQDNARMVSINNTANLITDFSASKSIGASIRCVSALDPTSQDAASSATAVDGDTFEYNGLMYSIVSLGDDLWLDRNLGATSTTNIGSYYQWGRRTDGHETLTAFTNTQLSVLEPTQSNEFVIRPALTNVAQASDWRTAGGRPWNGNNGINNPCPPSWHIPTANEVQDAQANGLINATEAVRLISGVSSGIIHQQDGTTTVNTSHITFWTSTPDATAVINRAFATQIQAGSLNLRLIGRANGLPIRCIKAQ